MPTSSFVESGFWCFDALFVPQQHPAREVQDTFYLSDPAVSLPPPKEYYERVSRVHEHGGYGSTGYRAPWSHDKSRKLLLPGRWPYVRLRCQHGKLSGPELW